MARAAALILLPMPAVPGLSRRRLEATQFADETPDFMFQVSGRHPLHPGPRAKLQPAVGQIRQDATVHLAK